MSTQAKEITTVATAKLIGGHPGIDFVNTVDARRDGRGPDRLVSYQDLLTWCGRVGLLEPSAAVELERQAKGNPSRAEAVLRRARQLRESLYAVLSASGAGTAPAGSDVDRIARAAKQAQDRRCLIRKSGEQGGFAWTWAEDLTLEDPVLRIADAVSDLLTTKQLSRIKECAGLHCGWLFLDTSRNGLRRWCSDAECGAPARVRRFRAKTAAS